MSDKKLPLLQGAWAVLAAFVTGTSAWVAWGVFTPGDFFGNGGGLLWPSIAMAVVFGGYVGWGLRRRGRIAFGLAAVFCAAFWLLSADGWWAKPPPRRARAPAPLTT